MFLQLCVVLPRRQVQTRDFSFPTGVLPSHVSFGAERTDPLQARDVCSGLLKFAASSRRLVSTRELSFTMRCPHHFHHLEQGKFTHSNWRRSAQALIRLQIAKTQGARNVRNALDRKRVWKGFAARRLVFVGAPDPPVSSRQGSARGDSDSGSGSARASKCSSDSHSSGNCGDSGSSDMRDTKGCGNNPGPTTQQQSLINFGAHVLVSYSFFFSAPNEFQCVERIVVFCWLSYTESSFKHLWSPKTPPIWSPSSRAFSYRVSFMVWFNIVLATEASSHFCS